MCKFIVLLFLKWYIKFRKDMYFIDEDKYLVNLICVIKDVDKCLEIFMEGF